MRRSFNVMLVALLVIGCNSTFDASRLDNDLADTSWLFERAETGDGVIENEPTASQRASITFGGRVEDAAAYEVSGYNGCNFFSGKYSLGSQKELTFSEIVQTERACRPEEGRIEEVFNRGILGARSYAFDGEVLVIDAPGQSVKLRLIPSIAG